MNLVASYRTQLKLGVAQLEALRRQLDRTLNEVVDLDHRETKALDELLTRVDKALEILTKESI